MLENSVSVNVWKPEQAEFCDKVNRGGGEVPYRPCRGYARKRVSPS